MLLGRRVKDGLFNWGGILLVVLAVSLAAGIGGALLWKSWPLLSEKPLTELLLASRWRPGLDSFGFLPFILGTAWVTVLALVISLPVCVLCALFLSEYAGSRFRAVVVPMIDLLAGIPSVIYGMWGVVMVVPFVRDVAGPAFGVSTTGYSVLAGAVVLSLMVCPVIVNVSFEVLRSVPKELREISLSLGATKWQTEKLVVIRKAGPGLLAAAALGLSRAVGETMAVLMVCGNVAKSPASVFDSAYPLPALIANNYGEMLSVPKYDAALMLAALILFAIVLLFNVLSRLVLSKVEGMVA